ncbi:hypothetical protein DRQ25_13450 [Candidatus Fermentibacteria bacterium]|nr:MAG: hypothetical protein DRQ25_13450 [Candidatus Fermentibacteria bacterium]
MTTQYYGKDFGRADQKPVIFSQTSFGILLGQRITGIQVVVEEKANDYVLLHLKDGRDYMVTHKQIAGERFKVEGANVSLSGPVSGLLKDITTTCTYDNDDGTGTHTGITFETEATAFWFDFYCSSDGMAGEGVEVYLVEWAGV